MSLDELDAKIEVYMMVMGKSLPDEPYVKATLAQSMMMGVDRTLQSVFKSNTFQTLLPEIRSSLTDVPNNIENNQEIAARLLSIVQERYPKVISLIDKSNKKKIHVAGILTGLIREVRNDNGNSK